MSFTDFSAGLSNVNDYLDAKHHLSGTTALGSDALRVVAGANYSFSIRELICGILGGHGFKLPNIQICLFANLNALLGLDKLQAVLRTALNALADAFSSFMDLLSIDSVLGRLNSVLNEAMNVANMINFCGNPINPIAIPNMLEQAFGSLLGKGDALISKIGIPPIDTCLAFGDDGTPTFNVDAFLGDNGIFGDIAANYAAIATGDFGLANGEEELLALTYKIDGVAAELRTLVDEENDIKGAYTIGGSDFPNDTGGDGDGGDGDTASCSTQLGVLHDPTTGSIADNTRIAASLKGVYDNLAGYPVQYKDQETGEIIEYPNIFHLFVEPGVLAILDKDVNDNTTVSEQIPVYDYCGNVIGYTTNTLQGNSDQKSEGQSPSSVSCPGDSTNYDPTDPDSRLVYPRTTATGSPSDTTIASGVSASTASVDTETGFTSDYVNTDEGGVASGDTGNYARKRSGDTHFYNSELEYYDNPYGNVTIRLERRRGGNYVTKHALTVDKNTTIYINDHNRKEKEISSFELMIEHVSDIVQFSDTQNIIWEGGATPTFNSGNYHIIEMRNYGGADWFVTQTNNNYWLAKLVGSFPIP